MEIIHARVCQKTYHQEVKESKKAKEKMKKTFITII